MHDKKILFSFLVLVDVLCFLVLSAMSASPVPVSLSAGGATMQIVQPATTQSPSSDQATYKADVVMVNVVFTVTDKNMRFISDMTETDFEVYEDGASQKILYFNNYAKGGEIPITMALLVDTSGSVKDKLQLEVDTAIGFLRSVLRPKKDLALIMQFESGVELVQDLTDDMNLLEKGLLSLRAGGGTSLYDAIYLAVTEKLRHEAGRKVVVVLSDGADNQSKVKKEEAIQVSQRADALIYGIGVRGSGYPSDFGVLKSFAKDTGGRFFQANIKLAELQKAFQDINQDLKNQYALAYSSTNSKTDGAFRRIQIRPKRKNLVIKARTGYYAPSEK